MKHSRLTALFCVLAYLVVFAHSAIAHEHHLVCHGGGEQQESESTHPFHYGSCEQLNTFIASEAGALPALHFQAFSLSALVPTTDTPHLPERGLIRTITYFCPDGFTDPPLKGVKGLRAPPTDC